ncbi:MAG: DUF1080 domain-containing protein [Myxococcales bacterium]
MINSRHDNWSTVAFVLTAAFGLGAIITACTPATSDTPTGTGGQGQTGSASGGSSSGGSSGSAGSGGSSATGGMNDSGSGGGNATGGSSSTGSGGTTGTGSGGTGMAGSNGSGGSTMATGGSTATGGATAAVGCNWMDDPVAKTAKFRDPAPAVKIFLFDGTTSKKGPGPVGWHKQTLETDKTKWVPIDWTVEADNTLLVKPTGTQAVEVQSDMQFEDLCVHVEYLTPDPSTYAATHGSVSDVQTHGNSGVYLKSAYEMQILDTFGMAVADDGCGAVYKEKAPYTSACFQHGTWNTYEIEFKASVWNGTTRTKNAQFVKVALNGTVVQGVASWIKGSAPVEITKFVTPAGTDDLPGPRSLGLQNHLDPVRFRNIWVTIPKY